MGSVAAEALGGGPQIRRGRPSRLGALPATHARTAGITIDFVAQQADANLTHHTLLAVSTFSCTLLSYRCVVLVGCAAEALAARAAGMRCVGVHPDIDHANLGPGSSGAAGLEAACDVVFASLGGESNVEVRCSLPL